MVERKCQFLFHTIALLVLLINSAFGQTFDSIHIAVNKISLKVTVSTDILRPKQSIKFSLEYKNNTPDTLYFLPISQFLYISECVIRAPQESVRKWIIHEGDSVLFSSSWQTGSPIIYLFWDESKFKPIRKREIVATYTLLLPLQTHKVDFDLPYMDVKNVSINEWCLYNETNQVDVKAMALLMLLPEHQIANEVIKSNSFRLLFISEE